MKKEMKRNLRRDNMNWHYYACNRCNETFRTPIDNPDFHVKCANCEFEIFHEISKADYDKSRSEAPFPK